MDDRAGDFNDFCLATPDSASVWPSVTITNFGCAHGCGSAFAKQMNTMPPKA